MWAPDVGSRSQARRRDAADDADGVCRDWEPPCLLVCESGPCLLVRESGLPFVAETTERSRQPLTRASARQCGAPNDSGPAAHLEPLARIAVWWPASQRTHEYRPPSTALSGNVWVNEGVYS